jgi:uncharacterized membrane protein YcgQ (UPF0703/DUF1980 family)
MMRERLRLKATQNVFAVPIPRRISMNKLALTLATVAALGFSTAAFAQTSTTASTPQRVQSAQSQTHATKHIKKRHHVRHYASQKSKKVVIKHTPATKPVKSKVAS